MKAILVIETDAEHIEDLHISTIWNDVYPVDLGKDVYFKPMPQMKWEWADAEDIIWNEGWNACLDEIEEKRK